MHFDYSAIIIFPRKPSELRIYCILKFTTNEILLFNKRKRSRIVCWRVIHFDLGLLYDLYIFV